jgi:hypothetical protein
MIHRYLFVDLWLPMWPNVFAPSAITLAAVVISHVKQIRQRDRHHQELKDHITKTIGGSGNGQGQR